MIRSLQDVALKNKRVLIREDFNVPVDSTGNITHDARIKEAIPTLQYVLSQGAHLLILSHRGRPIEGAVDPSLSLYPIVKRLHEYLNTKVRFITDYLEGVAVEPGEVVLLENSRFLSGEQKNDPTLAKKLASLCDVFVMDAFSVAHRAAASTVGVAEYAPEVCAGFLLEKELEALSKILQNPCRPVVAVLGGAKVSTKFKVIKKILEKVDTLILGGGMANTFLRAQGFAIGGSLYEADWIEEAKQIIEKAKKLEKILLLPEDVVVAKELSATADVSVKNIEDLEATDCIFDIGPLTCEKIRQSIQQANTILWNGPLGVFECKPFEAGTKELAHFIAQSDAFSLAGGGDTLAAIDAFGVGDAISYQSTAGGAFLEFLEGSTLPAIEILKTRSQESSLIKVL